MRVFLNYLLILILSDLVNSKTLLNFLPKSYGKATSVYCTYDRKYVTNVTCKLKPITWQRSVMHLEADLVQVLRNITFNLEAFKYTNQFRPFLMNTTFNFCATMRNGRAKNPYLQSILNILAKSSNIFHECPHMGNIYVRDAYPDFSLIPFNFPIGTYKLVAKVFEDWPLIPVGMVSYIFRIERIYNATRIT